MDTFPYAVASMSGWPAIAVDDETWIVYGSGYFYLVYKFGDAWSWQYLNLNWRPFTAKYFEPAARKLYDQLIEAGLLNAWIPFEKLAYGR